MLKWFFFFEDRHHLNLIQFSHHKYTYWNCLDCGNVFFLSPSLTFRPGAVLINHDALRVRKIRKMNGLIRAQWKFHLTVQQNMTETNDKCMRLIHEMIVLPVAYFRIYLTFFVIMVDLNKVTGPVKATVAQRHITIQPKLFKLVLSTFV